MPLGIPNFVSNLFSGLKKGGSNTNSSSNPNPNTSSETETMEEPMEVDPLDTSNTAPNNDDTPGSKTVVRTSSAVEQVKDDNNQGEDNISIKTETIIKQDVEEMEASTDNPNTQVLPDSLEVVKIIKLDASLAAGITDGNQIILTEDVLGDLPAGISVDGEAVVVVLPPEGDEDEPGIIQVAEILPTAGVADADNDEFPIINSETAANVEVLDVIETEVTEEAEVEVCSESVTDPGGTLLGAVSGPDLDEKEIGEEVAQEEFGDENDAESFVEITRRRVSQDRDGNCYCGKDRNLNIAELLCASCNRWYHESCIGYQLGKLVPFMANYVFICKNCSPTGLESFKRNQAQFTQMCVTALANLTQASAKDGTNRKIFSKDKDIIPFFDMHWEGMTTTTRRVTQSWHSTVSKALQKEVGTAFVSEESLNDPDSPYFGLMCSDLTQIRPNYDAMIKGGHLKVTELGVHQSSNSIFRGRGAKRRTVGGDPVVLSQASVAKKTRGDSFLPKMILGHGYPVDHPYNKDGYRYILAEPDSNAPYRQEFDESSDWAGKPIPGWLYRVLNPCSVLLALHDRAPQLKVSEDRLSVTGEKGYCMIRATHGVTKGCWYWEAKITDMPEGSHTRIGFSQPYGNLQGPLGYDRYGYSWRSRYGTKFHEAKGKSYCKGGYGLGDTLGFLIEMPETNPTAPSVPQSFKDRPLVRFKSHLYYEDKDDKAQESEPLTIRKDSKIICFKNGVCQGIAYQDMNEGIYYPAVSLFKGVTVNVNFGPDFWAEPDKNIYHHKGMYERSDDAIVQQTVSDLVFLTENHGKLRLENAVALPQ